MDVTSQFSITNPTMYNPPGTQYYDKWRQDDVEITNNGVPVNGPVHVVISGIPDPNGAVLEVADRDRIAARTPPYNMPIATDHVTVTLLLAGQSWGTGVVRKFNVVFHNESDAPFTYQSAFDAAS